MDIVEFLQNKTPFVFAKFGDGEYFASIESRGGNCDGTPYTKKLGEGVRSAIQTLAKANAYIGKWIDSPQVAPYFQGICNIPIQWENYNIFIFRTSAEYFNRCLPIYQALKASTQQKIYVCNSSMVEGTSAFLGIDSHIVIDSRNWFETSFDSVVEKVKQTVSTETPLILLSAGMGAKPLIAKIVETYPMATVLDIGSALDLICSSRRTRDYHTLTDSEIARIRISL